MSKLPLEEIQSLRSRMAADGMPAEKIALLLRIKTGTVLEVMAAKQAHIEKCRKKLGQEAKP